MKLNDRVEDGVVILELCGKIIGGADAELFHQRLLEYVEQGKRNVIVDLGKVDWMNSGGLSLLITTYKFLNDNGGQLRLVNITKKIQSLLTITKLATIFESYESLGEAMKSFE